LALDLLEDSRLDILLTGSSMFADLTDVFLRLALNPGEELCHLIRYHRTQGLEQAQSLEQVQSPAQE
jgi:hypothetical protein